jgi:hypothetical protein
VSPGFNLQTLFIESSIPYPVKSYTSFVCKSYIKALHGPSNDFLKTSKLLNSNSSYSISKYFLKEPCLNSIYLFFF